MPDSVELVKFFASFAVILTILYALYYYVQNFTPKLTPKGRYIHIVESRVIGKNRFLLLVEVKDKVFLLALDEGGTKVLKEWERESS